MAQPAPAVDDEEQSRNMRYFEIPTQPLTSAVTSFGDQAAIQVTVDGSILSGLTSTPVSGNLTPVEALNRLLNGTGIGFRWVNGNSVALERAAETTTGDDTIRLDTLQIEGATTVERETGRSEEHTSELQSLMRIS